LILTGAAETIAQIKGWSAAQKEAAITAQKLSAQQAALNKRTFLGNQVLFTLRRLLFFTTLGFIGLGASVLKMGFDYNNAMNTSRVALSPVITSTAALNAEMKKLFVIAATSPFLFKDTVLAFRQMYLAFKPLGFSIEFTNQTIQALLNGLSATGRTTPANFNRAAIALQHLAYIGRPTGQIILQLGRDGLPIYSALNKELGLTGNQIHNIARSGVTAKDVIGALNRYIATTPGFMNAAMRQANSTLSGSIQQFKDLISQASGGATGGVFEGLRKTFAGVNQQLAGRLKAGKPVTFTNIAEAFNKQLTPSTDLLIIAFTLLKNTLSELILLFGILFKTVALLLKPIGLLSNATGHNNYLFHILGQLVGILIFLWIVYRTQLMLVAFWQAIVNTEFGFGAFLAGAFSVALGILSFVVFGLIFALQTLAFVILADPVVAVAVLIAVLVGLYFHWKAFHDLVNRTFAWIKANWRYVLAGLLFPLAPMILELTVIVRFWREILNVIMDVVRWFERMDKALSKGIMRVLGFVWHGLTAPFQGFATGGTVGSSSRPVLVGERGPELLTLPSGTRVTPIAAGMGGGMFNIKIYPQDIYLDGKKVGEAVANRITDKQARR
jgi:hypothetical protein